MATFLPLLRPTDHDFPFHFVLNNRKSPAAHRAPQDPPAAVELPPCLHSTRSRFSPISPPREVLRAVRPFRHVTVDSSGLAVGSTPFGSSHALRSFTVMPASLRFE
ncbi:hypothetical protein ABZX51_010129 [Aspergillus tubingensis]